MWRIRKWPFLSAAARQAAFLEQCSICVSTLRQTALYPSTFETEFFFNCRSQFFFFFGGWNCSCCVGCRRVAAGSRKNAVSMSGILYTVYIFYLCDVGLHIHKLLGGGQLSLGYICAVCRPVHNRLLIWVPQAVVDHKKIQHQVHRRRSLQEMALVKDAWDICFHVYSNQLLLLDMNSTCS